MRTRRSDADAKQVENAGLHISSVRLGAVRACTVSRQSFSRGQAAGFSASRAGLPQHFLYLRPERQGHGEFRGVLDDLIGAWTGAGAAVLQNELAPSLRICSQRRLSACVMSASRSSSPIRLPADGLAVTPMSSETRSTTARTLAVSARPAMPGSAAWARMTRSVWSLRSSLMERRTMTWD